MKPSAVAFAGVLISGLSASAPGAQWSHILVNPGTLVQPGDSIPVTVDARGDGDGIERLELTSSSGSFASVSFSFPADPPQITFTQPVRFLVPQNATPGERIDLQVDGSFYGGATDVHTSHLIVEQSTPPANDNFPGSALSGASGSVGGSNLGATRQPGEPAPIGDSVRTIWYSWTPDSLQNVTFTLVGASGFVVHRGNAVGALEEEARSHHIAIPCSLNPSFDCGHKEAEFTAVPGVVYRIQIMNATAPADGAVTLEWTSSAPTAADSGWALYE